MRRFSTLLLVPVAAFGLMACGDDSSATPMGGTGGGSGGSAGEAGAGGSINTLRITPIADQVVTRNFITPRSFDIEVAVAELDTAFSIDITSNRESVVPSSTSECPETPCAFTFTPDADRNATAEVDVTVTLGDLRAETSFQVTVQPRLVRDATDGSPPAKGSLRDVVAQSEDGDIIGFDTEGAFSANTTIAMAQTLEIDSRQLRFEGPTEPRVTIQSGESFRAMSIFDRSEVVITNLDFAGVRPLEGGLIDTDNNTMLELRDCTLRDAVADLGGAIRTTGPLRIQNCTFINNAAMHGGAVFARGQTEIANTTFDSNGFDPIVDGTTGGGLATTGPAELIDVIFVRNRAFLGGGLHLGDDSVVTMTGGEIGDRVDRMNHGNQAIRGGGAYLAINTRLELGSVSVKVNGAERGAGFYVGEGPMSLGTTLAIVESQIEQNFATQLGGGVFLDGGTITMDTISFIGPENEAGTQDGGGGVWVTNGGNIDDLPPERVTSNRGGPMGAESDINRDPNDF